MGGPRLPVLLALAAVLPAAGCVERRFVIESNVPGAQVYVNNVAVGPGPADARWEYPGRYEFRLVAQGYEPLRVYKQVRPKWYEYPGLDLFFEVLWPFHIEDVRRFRFDLVPASPVRTDELLDAANQLRERAANLPPPRDPDPPRERVVPAPPPAPPAVIPVPAEPGSPAVTRPPAGPLPPVAPTSLPARPQ